jgi:hypothetical protein
LIPNYDDLNGRHCLRNRQSFHKVSDSSIISYRGRVRIFNVDNFVICHLFNNTVSNSDCIILNDQTTANNELGKMCKEAVMV